MAVFGANDVTNWNPGLVIENYPRAAPDMVKKDDRTDCVALHVASGKKAQWVTKLPREIAEPYADRYAEAQKTLGYADNSDWVSQYLPAKDIEAAA